MTDTVTLYRADDGWRWRYQASNGRVLADGSQGYVRIESAIRGACRVMRLAHRREDVVVWLRARCEWHVSQGGDDRIRFVVEATR